MTGRPWTPDEDERLLTLYAERKTYVVIAGALGRPPTSVPSRLRTLRVPPRRGTSVAIAPPPPAGIRGRRTGIKYGGASKQTLRDCLCCRKSFLSAGAGNRLCDKCRAIPLSPYAL